MHRTLTWIGVLLACAAAGTAHAQVQLDATTTSITEDFTEFRGQGFAPTPAASQLDSDDWRVLGLSDGDLSFGVTVNSGDYARGNSTGAVESGGVYAFDVSGLLGGPNFALGAQPGGSDLTPGSIQFRVRNATGRDLRAVRVLYTLLVYNDEARSTAHTFRIIRESDGAEIVVEAFTVNSPANAGPLPTWQATTRDGVIDLDAMPIADGDALIFSWDTDDLGGSGSRDEYAIDDVTVSIPACGNGAVDDSETCDDGDIVTETECPYGTASCTLCDATCSGALALTGRVCGDSTQDPEEACDDGNAVSETECEYGTEECTACDATCENTLSLMGRVCGDGTQDPEEVCDDGNTVSETECEYGTPSCMPCNATCEATLDLSGEYCGDGTTNGAEACDDGNAVTETECEYGTAECTACDATCENTVPLMGGVCGDGTQDPEEACDDGNTVSETECAYGTAECTTCDATCENASPLTGRVCGDGTQDPEEACDDGNTVTETECAYGTESCAACDATCEGALTLSGRFCGDEVIDAEDGEECDDGNDVAGDGCDACTLEEVPDAGVDAGADLDAGVDPDAGMVDPDASVPDEDASVGEDGGTNPGADAGGEPMTMDGGCGCSAPGRAPAGATWLLAALLLGLVVRRLRR